MLQKVYRNTKQVLRYITSLGFHADEIDQAHEGPEVKEYIAPESRDLVMYIEGQVEKILADKEVGIIGLIIEDETIRKICQEKYKAESIIHVSDIRGSQGVEFETVFLVGASRLLSHGGTANEELVRISHDLLYIGLTRAMNALHIVDTIVCAPSRVAKF